MRPLIRFILACSPLIGIVQAQGQTFTRLDRKSLAFIDSVIQSQMDKQHIVGLSVALIKGGQIVYLKGHGFADREFKVRATPQTMYRMASISKTITAVATLQAWERGEIDLKASVRDYVPEYPSKQEGKISIEQLISNEGGIQQYNQTAPYDRQALERYIAEHPNDHDPIAAIDIFKEQPLYAKPGSKFNYSSFSFNLAAAALERATKIPFEDLIRLRIAEIGEMPYLQPEYRNLRPYPQQATGYGVVDSAAVLDKGSGHDYEDVSWKLGGGGFICTTIDLANFVLGLMNGSFLKPETMQKMLTMRYVSGLPTYYGLGVFLSSRNGKKTVSHFGHQTWARSLMFFSPDNQDGIVMMSNTYGTDLLPIAQTLFDYLPTSKILGPAFNNPIPCELAAPIWIRPRTKMATSFTEFTAKWTPVPFADAYECQYATDSSFTNYQIQEVRQVDSLRIRNLEPQRTYYLRIRALNRYLHSGIQSPWSAVVELRTGTQSLTLGLPYSTRFERRHVFGLGRGEIQYGVGHNWYLETETPGSRYRLGKWAMTSPDSLFGITLDKFPGMETAKGYLVFSANIGAIPVDRSLVLSFNYIAHGDSLKSATNKVWIRGNDQAKWIEVLDWAANTKPGVTKKVDSINVTNLLKAANQVPGDSFQVSFGYEAPYDVQDMKGRSGLTLTYFSLVALPRKP